MSRWFFRTIEERQAAEQARKDKALDNELKRECKYYKNQIVETLAELGIDHWLPKGERSSRLAEKYFGGVRRQKIEIIQTRYDPAGNAIYFWIDTRKLPYRSDITRLYTDEVLETLSYACQRRITWRGDYGNGAWYCLHRNGVVNAIPTYFKWQDARDALPDDATPLTYIVGVTENNRLIKTDVAILPHLVAAGSTFTGKSVHLNSILCQWLDRNTPDTLQLMMIDLKGGMEFSHYEGLPHLINGRIIKEPEDMPEALDQYLSIIEERGREIAGRGLKTIEAWNTKFKAERMPYLVLVVDELASVLRHHDTKIAKVVNAKLNRILATARAAGGHAILCTQSPRSDVIDPLIKANLGGRICFAVPSFHDSINVLDIGIASEIDRDIPGRAIWSFGPKFTEIQSPFISDEKIAEIVKKASALTGLVEQATTYGLNDVLKIAIDYYDGQLQYKKIATQLVGKMSRNEVQRIIQGLNGHEYVIDGVGYRIERRARGMHGGNRLVPIIPIHVPDLESPLTGASIIELAQLGILPAKNRIQSHGFLKPAPMPIPAELQERG